MIWFIIGIAVAILLIVHSWADNFWFETVIGHIIGNIGQLVMCLLCALIVCVISSFIVTDSVEGFSKKETSQEIYALSDNIGSEGSFFLGTGQVGSDISYYYVVDSENGKHIESVKRENAYVKYGDEHTVTIVSYEFENKALHWIAFSTKENDYIFRVPEGTITSSFQIDLN